MSACRPERGCFESVSRQTVQRCACIWWSGCLEELRRIMCVRKMERDPDRETVAISQKAKYFFSFCVHLVVIGDINDGPVSVDQSR